MEQRGLTFVSAVETVRALAVGRSSVHLDVLIGDVEAEAVLGEGPGATAGLVVLLDQRDVEAGVRRGGCGGAGSFNLGSASSSLRRGLRVARSLATCRWLAVGCHGFDALLTGVYPPRISAAVIS